MLKIAIDIISIAPLVAAILVVAYTIKNWRKLTPSK